MKFTRMLYVNVMCWCCWHIGAMCVLQKFRLQSRGLIYKILTRTYTEYWVIYVLQYEKLPRMNAGGSLIRPRLARPTGYNLQIRQVHALALFVSCRFVVCRHLTLGTTVRHQLNATCVSVYPRSAKPPLSHTSSVNLPL